MNKHDYKIETEEQKELLRGWVAALRSGNYPQCKSRLREFDADGKYSYCCLGVLGDLMIKKFPHVFQWDDEDPRAIRWTPYNGEESGYDTKEGFVLPAGMAILAGFIRGDIDYHDGDPTVAIGPEYTPEENTLAALNDAGYTFERIAELIEMNFLNEDHDENRHKN